MRLRFTPQAQADLEGIADYIAADNRARASSFVRELRVQCQRIAINPRGYRRRPELGEGIRSCAHGNYVIFFAESAKDLTVIRILHGARDIARAFEPAVHKAVPDT